MRLVASTAITNATPVTRCRRISTRWRSCTATPAAARVGGACQPGRDLRTRAPGADGRGSTDLAGDRAAAEIRRAGCPLRWRARLLLAVLTAWVGGGRG